MIANRTLALLSALICSIFVAAALGVRWALRDEPAGPPPLRAQSARSGDDRALVAGALEEIRAENQRLAEQSQETAGLLAALGARLERLERERMNAPPWSGERPGWSDEIEELDPDQAERAAAEELERAVAETEAQFGLLEDTLRTEGVDAAWAESAQRDLAGAFEGVAEHGLWLESAECGRTFCRVEVAVDPDAPEGEAFGYFQHVTPWSGQTFFSFKGGKDGGGLLYLAREGYELPRFDAAIE